jgi:NAD(P)-dependent dehydrogenase (short-subunit alcohol dehydrogenase family)
MHVEGGVGAALVTGGSSGIGLALARLLVRARRFQE